MSHNSLRAKWNTANAKLANKPFENIFKNKPAPTPDMLYKDALGQRNALYAYAVKVTAKFYALRDGLSPVEAEQKAKDEVDELIAF